MKQLTKILTLLLATAMLLMLTGCPEKEEDEFDLSNKDNLSPGHLTQFDNWDIAFTSFSRTQYLQGEDIEDETQMYLILNFWVQNKGNEPGVCFTAGGWGDVWLYVMDGEQSYQVRGDVTDSKDLFNLTLGEGVRSESYAVATIPKEAAMKSDLKIRLRGTYKGEIIEYTYLLKDALK